MSAKTPTLRPWIDQTLRRYADHKLTEQLGEFFQENRRLRAENRRLRAENEKLTRLPASMLQGLRDTDAAMRAMSASI